MEGKEDQAAGPPSSKKYVIEEADVRDAMRRISPHINRTPLLTSSFFNTLTSASVFFKCENFQKSKIESVVWCSLGIVSKRSPGFVIVNLYRGSGVRWYSGHSLVVIRAHRRVLRNDF